MIKQNRKPDIKPENIKPTDCEITLFCLVCNSNGSGICKEYKKPVPKLKMSAIEWPK
jgi:hypothetical protein